MTEAEWLACNVPMPMLGYLGRKYSARKRRLFACACVRQIWPLLGDDRCRRAVEMVERCVDGLASTGELGAAGDAARVGRPLFEGKAPHDAREAASALTGGSTFFAVQAAVDHAASAVVGLESGPPLGKLGWTPLTRRDA